MRLYVTIYENTADEAIARIRSLDADHDGVEVRAERHPGLDLRALRAATAKPLILTHRGMSVDEATIQRAIDAGIELVDVEWRPDLDRAMVERHRERIIVSHHDYHHLDHVEQIVADMRGLGCAETKLAATPETFADNERLLRLIDSHTSVVGMGERGLYARLLAPFRGSPLTFVAVSSIAAPGQLTLERALAIYGDGRESLRAEKVFAIAGNPAGHSLSPSIHNRLFREKGLPGAYTIASFETFDEIAQPFLRGEPAGLSVTAPFKEEAFVFAQSISAELGANASACGAVNTLVNVNGRILADNTDVDGFAAILKGVGATPRKIAIVGAGGTARAALAAARGRDVTVYNRTPGKLGARPLDELRDFDGDVLIDTVPEHVDLPLRAGMTYIRASYGTYAANIERAQNAGAAVIDGLALLNAQALRQHELFLQVFA
ncbi:MAG TPA: type I 3-dehydroquinate dehydratase [Thermoanaerobaculia bacterium]